MIKWRIREDYIEITANETLSDQDYRELLPVLDNLLELKENLKSLIILDHFKGWEVSALWKDLTYDIKHGGAFGPMAVVGENAAQKWLTQISNIFFPSEIKYFEKEELDQARRWLIRRQSDQIRKTGS